jgi:hypothetical protein
MTCGHTKQPHAGRTLAEARESWAQCVALLLGPIIVRADRQRRQREALHLAAAALRAAGEMERAADVEALAG